MILVIFISAAVLLLVGGVLFILKGLKDPQSESIIPLSDLKDFKNEKHPPFTAFNQITAPPISPIRAELSTADPHELSVNSLEELQKRIENLTQENQKLNEALTREMASKEAKTLSEEEQKVLKDQEQQLSMVQQSLEELTKENYKLVNQLKEGRDKVQQLEQTIHDLENEKKIIESREELKLNELDSKITELQKENAELNVHRTSLEKMRADYQTMLNSKKVLEESLEKAQKNHEEKIMETKEAYHALSQQQQEAIQKQIQVIGEKFSEAMGTIAELKKEKEEWQKSNQQMMAELEKTKGLNLHLIDKERKSQYELIKSRAQAAGLEKICEDFKIQIEEMSKSLSAQKT